MKTQTNQTPSECKFFYAGWLCNERKKKSRRYSYERPCILICDRDTCPDYDPREDELKAFQDSITIEIPVPALPFFLGADFASEPSKEVCSLVIMGEPKINKPRNLKYPNKKRARRVWKKWKRRFGTTLNKAMYFPNVEIKSEYDEDGVNVNVKPIKND